MCSDCEYSTGEAVEILAMIRRSVQEGQRSPLTDEVVETIDGIYLDILENMEME
jgi:hypothetical protein